MHLKICGLNHDIVWENPQDNFKIIECRLADATADVFLLPEMFSTGFSMNVQTLADCSCTTLRWMKDFAKKKNAAVAGSVSVCEGGEYFNRFFFVQPNGNFQHYDKRHLFSYSGENKIYTPGIERVIVEYKGVRILLQVCYDLRFPVFSRNRDDYDVVLYVANWPASRVEAWSHLLKARAIENLTYVFGLNRIGEDGNGLSYEESSGVFFADGKEVTRKEGNLVFADIDLESLRLFRDKFGFLNDRDDFVIK